VEGEGWGGGGEGREVNKQCAACLALSNHELNVFIDFSSNFELLMALLTHISHLI